MTSPTPSTVTDEMCRVAMAAYDKGCNGYYAQAPSMRAALEAALDGMAVVPREPTEAMLEAGEQTFVSGMKGTPVSTPLDVWSAMIAATPPAQGE